MKYLKNHLDDVQEAIDYRFNNIDLLYQAFTRSSYSTQYGGENNEILEFIGDRVLDYYVTKAISDEFGFLNPRYCIVAHKREADLSELKRDIVSNKALAKRIDSFGFANYLIMGDSDIDNHVERGEKVKADLFEAILGAIAIDSDWDPDALQNSVECMLQIETFFKNVDTEEESPEVRLESAVTTLKELGEHGKCTVPEYVLPEEQTYRGGENCWECTCYVRSWNVRKTAYAPSKKEAKKYAAYLVLCARYGIPNAYEEDDEA